MGMSKECAGCSLTAFRHRGGSATYKKDVPSGLKGKDTNTGANSELHRVLEALILNTVLEFMHFSDQILSL